MTLAQVRFLGSNCDQDTKHAFNKVLGVKISEVWYTDTELPPVCSGVILPGGFSHGDYLRAGAIAARAPIMNAIAAFAKDGGPVLGICNGFQILCERNILPGVLLPNKNGRFICDLVELEMCGAGQGILKNYDDNERIKLPIAHAEGNFFANSDTLNMLESENLVACRYFDKDISGHGALNGSRRAIAGIFGGPYKNVLGLMPHPERSVESSLGGIDGLRLLASL